MFQSPLRHAALFRKPSRLPARLAMTSAVAEPASMAARRCHGLGAAVAGGPLAGSALPCSVIGCCRDPAWQLTAGRSLRGPARPRSPVAQPGHQRQRRPGHHDQRQGNGPGPSTGTPGPGGARVAQPATAGMLRPGGGRGGEPGRRCRGTHARVRAGAAVVALAGGPPVTVVPALLALAVALLAVVLVMGLG